MKKIIKITLFLCLLQFLAYKVFEDYIYFMLGGGKK